ncbi:MAG: hypothetical protein GX369_00580 [Euryarchaeota archaeon]|nr:hypothetical protein [Euryarchaeota archaeon]
MKRKCKNTHKNEVVPDDMSRNIEIYTHFILLSTCISVQLISDRFAE